ELPAPSLTPTTPTASLSPSNPSSVLLEGAGRWEQGGWTVVQIRGTPYVRGFQHGYLLAQEIEEAISVHDFLIQSDTGRDFDFFAQKAEEMFLERIDPEFVTEMEGIAAGAEAAGVQLSFRDILGWNAYVEMVGYWWPSVSDVSPTIGTDHCSALIATGSFTTDGGIVMAHNTWADLMDFSSFDVVLDIWPDRGHRIVMQSAPGYIWSGTDFFINDAGLVGCETTFYGFQGFDETKLPTFVRAREAMQYGETIDQWVTLMDRQNNGGYANAWLLGDIKSGEIARFEQGLLHTKLDRTLDGYFAGFNAATDPGIQAECDGWSAEDPSNFSGARRVRWDQLLQETKGQLGAQQAMEMLADHYDTWWEAEEPSIRTLCAHAEVESAPYGALDGKVTTSELAREMSFWGRWGRPCGWPFVAEESIAANPAYEWLRGVLTDFPTQPWTRLGGFGGE
ncbi:MAG: C45 family peptidase, partial [bacterium]